MAEITAALVKALRDKTDAGMMDCKKALNECNGDMDAAVKYLREKGIAKAAAKADRDAKEGVIRAAVAPCGCSGIILELNCETDFCAKGDKFQGLVNDVANALMDSKAPRWRRLSRSPWRKAPRKNISRPCAAPLAKTWLCANSPA